MNAYLVSQVIFIKLKERSRIDDVSEKDYLEKTKRREEWKYGYSVYLNISVWKIFLFIFKINLQRTKNSIIINSIINIT